MLSEISGIFKVFKSKEILEIFVKIILNTKRRAINERGHPIKYFKKFKGLLSIVKRLYIIIARLKGVEPLFACQASELLSASWRIRPLPFVLSAFERNRT